MPRVVQTISTPVIKCEAVEPNPLRASRGDNGTRVDIFAEVRTDTYAKIYRHLDDLILWSCPIIRIEYGEMPELDAQATKGIQLSRDFIAIGKISVPINRGESTQAVGLFCNHDDFEDHAKIYSPVASFCAGEEKFVHIKNRSLFYQKLIDHWANFGKTKIPNIENEID